MIPVTPCLLVYLVPLSPPHVPRHQPQHRLRRQRLVARAIRVPHMPLGDLGVRGGEMDVHQPHRLVGQPAARPGDARHRDRDIRAEEPPRALSHLLRALLADCAVGLQRLVPHAQHAFLGAVGVAHRAAQEIAGTARHVGDQVAGQPTGTRFSQGEGQAARREELSDFRGKRRGRLRFAAHPFTFSTILPFSVVASGSHNVNVLPLPSSLVTSIRPPWALAIHWTIASPRPCPPEGPRLRSAR